MSFLKFNKAESIECVGCRSINFAMQLNIAKAVLESDLFHDCFIALSIQNTNLDIAERKLQTEISIARQFLNSGDLEGLFLPSWRQIRFGFCNVPI
jgi:hypothetical protein